jgi:hypothetical protein
MLLAPEIIWKLWLRKQFVHLPGIAPGRPALLLLHKLNNTTVNIEQHLNHPILHLVSKVTRNKTPGSQTPQMSQIPKNSNW